MSAGRSGASTASPYSPVSTVTGRGADRRRGASRTARPPATGAARGSPRAARRRPRRRTRAGCRGVDAVAPPDRGRDLGLERRGPCRSRSRAARSPRTRRARGTAARPSGSTRRPRTPAGDRARRGSASCHCSTVSSTASASARVCGRMSGSRLKPLTPSGTTPTVASRGKRSRMPSSVSSSTSPSFTPGHTTIWPCTSTPASSSAPSQRRLVAPRRLRSSAGPHLGIGRVDAHVERAEPLGDDPLEVRLGEAGQRGEVPVEEREAVVVVLQVQAAPHALGQLVDEAERAVVVAGADPVEDRALELEPERRAGGLLDPHLALEPAPAQLDLDDGLVGLHLVADDVPQLLAVQAQHLVARQHARAMRRALGRDSKNACGGHAGESRGRDRSALPLAGGRPEGAPRPAAAASAPGWRWRSRRSPGWSGSSSRPSTATTRSSTTGSWSSGSRPSASSSWTTSTRSPANVPLMLSAHGSAPEVVEAARAQGRFVVNAVCPLVTKVHHEAKVRAGQGLHDPLRRPRRPRRGGRHAGRRARVDPARRARGGRRRGPRHRRPTPTRSRCSPRPRSPCTTGRASPTGPGSEFPELWTATAQRPVLRDHQPPGGALGDRGPGRRGRRDRQRELVEHRRARQGRDAPQAARSCCASTAPRSSTSTSSATRRVVGVTAGASAPEDLVEQVIEHLAPTEGVELVNVTDEDEYFPPPRELRELLPRWSACSRPRSVPGRPVGDARLTPRRPLVDASTVLADLALEPAAAGRVAGERHRLVEQALELDLELGGDRGEVAALARGRARPRAGSAARPRPRPGAGGAASCRSRGSPRSRRCRRGRSARRASRRGRRCRRTGRSPRDRGAGCPPGTPPPARPSVERRLDRLERGPRARRAALDRDATERGEQLRARTGAGTAPAWP